MATDTTCPHFATHAAGRRPVTPGCSGCSAIDIPYDEQLAHKLSAMRQRFAKAALPGFDPDSIVTITPSPSPTAYRNRAKLVVAHALRRPPQPQLAVAGSQGHRGVSVARDLPVSTIRLGLYRAGTHDVVDIPGCPVQTPGINNTLAVLREAIANCGTSLYDEVAHHGDLRFVIVRESYATGEQLVGFVTRTATWSEGTQLAKTVLRSCRAVVGVLQHVNPRQGNAIFARAGGTRSLAGRETIEEGVCGVRVRLGLTSFFQVNTPVAERAYEAIVSGLAPTVSTTVLDLYCGVGAIGMVAARLAGRVIGIEEVGEAIALARTAASANHLGNTEWHEGLVEVLLPERAMSIGETSSAGGELVVALNPPRKGAGESVVDAIAALMPARVAYLSCAPPSLLRDLGFFQRRGYGLDHVELFDMFPQTDQVETLALLSRPM